MGCIIYNKLTLSKRIGGGPFDDFVYEDVITNEFLDAGGGLLRVVRDMVIVATASEWAGFEFFHVVAHTEHGEET